MPTAFDEFLKTGTEVQTGNGNAFDKFLAAKAGTSGLLQQGTENERVDAAVERRIANPSSPTLQRLLGGIYNMTIAQPAQAIATKSAVGGMSTEANALSMLEEDFTKRLDAGGGVTESELDWYKRNRGPLGKKVRAGIEAGTIKIVDAKPPVEQVSKVQEVLRQAENKRVSETDISVHISKAKGLADKAVDVVAGVVGFAAQLAVLKKAFPNVPQPAIWELQNQLSGGIPGAGAANYAAMVGPAKLFKGVKPTTTAGKLGKGAAVTGVEAAGFAGLSAAGQYATEGKIDPGRVLEAAAVPVGFKALGLAKSGVRRLARGPEAPAAEPQGFMAPEEGRVPTSAGAQPMMGVDPAAQAAAQLVDAVTKAKTFTKTEVAQKMHELRQRQAAGGEKRYQELIAGGMSEGEAAVKSRAGFAGGADVPGFEPPQLAPEAWKALDHKIAEVYAKRAFDRPNAQEALNKLRSGRYLTEGDFTLLDPVLGRPAAEQLYSTQLKHAPFEWGDLPGLLSQGSKMFVTTDLQTAWQTANLIPRHPVAFAKALKTTLVGHFSKAYSDKMRAQAEATPHWKYAEKNVEVPNDAPWSGKRSEFYRPGLSEQLQNVPIAKHYAALNKRAENRYVSGMRTFISTVWEARERKWAIKGLKGAELEAARKAYGRFLSVNLKLLGAKSPGGRKFEDAMNLMLFSTRATRSKFQQWTDLVGNPKMAGEQAAVFAANVAEIVALGGIVNLAGWAQSWMTGKDAPYGVSLNPLSSDFGQVRIGNHRFDLTFGVAPWFRTIARLFTSAYARAQLAGGTVETEMLGERVRGPLENLEAFARTKQSPIIGIVQSIRTGKDFAGNPIGLPGILARAITPLQIQDMYDSWVATGAADTLLAAAAQSMEDPSKPVEDESKPLPISQRVLAAVASGVLSQMSMPVRAYQDSPSVLRTKFRNRVAEQEYGKKWNELIPSEKEELLFKHKDILTELDTAVRARGGFDVKKAQKDLEIAGGLIKAKLSQAQREKLGKMEVGLDRKPGGFYLNDTRYNRMLDIYAKELESRLRVLDLEGLDPEAQKWELEQLVTESKAESWWKLREELRLY